MRDNLGRAMRMKRAAFTLIELLAVIAIITLLLGILVPAVDKVRTTARVTSTQATFGSLGAALETLKADQRVGGGFPPSVSDRPDRRVKSPYKTSLGITPDFEISGAGLLVWALAGADLLGAPGFRTFDVDVNSTLWADHTSDEEQGNNASKSGAYALRSDNKSPLQTRLGPFMDMGKIRTSKWNKDTKSFEIEAEVKARKSARQKFVARHYPMFLDPFGFPILYWRADPAGEAVVDEGTGNNARRGIYHWADNGALLEAAGGKLGDPLLLRPDGKTHNLTVQDNGSQTKVSFRKYIEDRNNPLKDNKGNYLRPHRPDSYLLVSPGPDGLYGTPDDISNFEHNGESPRG